MVARWDDPVYRDLVYYAARHVWRLEQRGSRPVNYANWKVWFEAKYGINYDEYLAARQREAGLNDT
jgi:hypothetical protein